jgi:hypothetical protein
LFAGVTLRKSGGTFELPNDRIKGAIRVLWRAEITQPRVWLGRDFLDERGGEPGFADAGLTGQQHDLAFAGLGSRPAPHEQFKFFFSSDECSDRAVAEAYGWSTEISDEAVLAGLLEMNGAGAETVSEAQEEISDLVDT